jgi:ATP synthase protein I
VINHSRMSRDDGPPKKRLPDTVREIGALSTVGISFVLAIVIGAGAGLLLDRLFGTTKVFFLIFFVLGVVAGILNVYRTAGKFLK